MGSPPPPPKPPPPPPPAPEPPPPFEEDEGLTKGKKKQAQRVALKIAKNAPGAGTNVA